MFTAVRLLYAQRWEVSTLPTMEKWLVKLTNFAARYIDFFDYRKDIYIYWRLEALMASLHKNLKNEFVICGVDG